MKTFKFVLDLLDTPICVPKCVLDDPPDWPITPIMTDVGSKIIMNIYNNSSLLEVKRFVQTSVGNKFKNYPKVSHFESV